MTKIHRTQTLTAERLRELLSYDPETGELRYLAVPGRRTDLVGKQAGWIHPDGYRRIHVDGVQHIASRLVYLHVTGEHPEAEVDHRSRGRADDRADNLRPATHGQNQMNRMVGRNNKLGIKGIYLDKGKYRATIHDGGKTHHLGRFSKLADAIAARNKAAAELHGEFARPSIDPDNPPVKVVITRYGGAALPEPRSTIGPAGEVCDIEFVKYDEAPV